MMISVIIPTTNKSHILDKIRTDLAQVEAVKEVIMVSYGQSTPVIKSKFPKEKIVVINKNGRGHSIVAGAKLACSETLLFLHDDTELPKNWAFYIKQKLDNPDIVGGGFSLRFNRTNRILYFLVFLSDCWYHITGELWGDRAIFVRNKIIARELKSLDVPIMEDVRLSNLMGRKGKTIMLKQSVITDAKTFCQKGIIKHTLDILVCRTMDLLNFSPRKIYDLYYAKS